jgi:hypothetical protein
MSSSDVATSPYLPTPMLERRGRLVLPDSEPATEVSTLAPTNAPGRVRGSGASPIEMRITRHSESNFYTGLDREEGFGVFVATFAPLPLGSAVEVTIRGFGRTLCVKGTVQWHRERYASDDLVPGMGVELNDMAPHTRAEVTALMHEREPWLFTI